MPWERPDNLPISHLTSLLLMMMMVPHAAVGRGAFGGEGAAPRRGLGCKRSARGGRRLGRGEPGTPLRATSLGLQLPPAGHLRLVLPAREGSAEQRTWPGRDPFLGMTLPALSHLLLEMGKHCLR